MRFVFISYAHIKEYHEPTTWLQRITAYRGVLESLARMHEVISIERIDFEGELMHNGVDYRFKHYAGRIRRLFPRQLHRYIRQLEPDVVVVHGLHFPLQVIQLRRTLGPTVKIIAQHHADKPFQGIKKHFQQWASHSLDACLFASREMGEEWVKAGNLAPASNIHEVMEVSSPFHPVEKSVALRRTGATGDPIFLWVGRLNENKDPLTVIRAFLQLLDTTPHATLYMAYHTHELLPEIKDMLAREPRYATAVRLIGEVPRPDLLYWYNSATYFLSGSYYEGSGTAVCQAMSCGCIPIVTDIPSFRMITQNGICGMLYEAGNVQALVTSLRQALEMDVPSKRQLSLEHFETTLSYDAIAGRFHAIASGLRLK